MQNARIIVDDLKGPGGNNIETANIDVSSVLCMPRREWAKPAYVVRPTLLEKLPEINIKKGTTQQFWITIYIPADTFAGLYHGKISIQAKGIKELILKLQLNVLPVQLLKPPTRQGMYCNFVDMETAPKFKSYPAKRIRKDILNMKEHGMNIIFLSIPPYCYSFKKDNKVKFNLEPL